MGWTSILAVVAASCLILGCGDSGGDEGGSSPSSDGGPTGPATSTTATSAPDGSSGGMPGTTSEGSGGSATSATTGPDGTTDGGSSSDDGESGAACEPAPPAGNTCLECVNANCCAAWQACYADEPCACVVDCHVIQGNSLGMCSNVCNLDSNLYQGLFFCGEASCLGSCDWDCC